MAELTRVWGVRKKVIRVGAPPVWDSSVHGMGETDARAYVQAHPSDSKLVTKLVHIADWEEGR